MAILRRIRNYRIFERSQQVAVERKVSFVRIICNGGLLKLQ